ncbi:Sortase and related acyltransferases [Mesorhizobium sp. J18]|uniref:GNAT family N-acetyltransferase n=1 Tax=Mesorhizobium sp. J18 TaxID=935263 RepID=UPI00119C0682|nr:GNAT family N-acetyltransferase [Mesorhizobium sp. J18]TWH01253.1 Sortase and related acyltransferases [Mesorhizobium sp. J18]
MSNWRFAPVTSANWNDFNSLFEAKGGPSYCWCMAWRPMSDRQTASNADRKAAISALVETGKPIGILAYDGAGKAVGWCSVAPRETFRKLSPQQNDEQEGIWSITCFFVRREHRGTGLSSALLDAAVNHALGQGAKAVEAYPVDPESPSYRFMGFKAMFAAHGFRQTGKAGSRRYVMLLEEL